MNRLAVAALACAAALAAVSPAHASEDATIAITQAAAGLAPNKYVWNDPGTPEAVTVVVSLPEQRAYVYRGSMMVAAATISSGKDGKDTPVGVFPILQKREVHRSNLYNDAPMPFMQRLTWDGVALHAGRNPGFPDSHGCIRLPAGFAKKLFAVTQVGSTVVVTDQVVAGEPLDASLLVEADAARANQEQLAMIDAQ
ncbi:L,D-transpeptidase family protein [Sphingomonas carotinifaciens]|uniref:L,D-transpeptidase family protein n=1 Tax=Sphingomonas carotinifaciens TaxID=1166323 RepID=A0A1G7ND95_9SPHN|nr:L,D-transpeptidase family protein [Sphingomonas carotinifaciens]MBB4087125.1 lipoprotein-anchoring transpeptidase ErfK/SrfK [Sphingomonas carotinifaciens]MWC43188.1 L,D-transpeptidase family protein [Sphingomonas carotinifaciens]SDF71891.1 Lipoprotein-anchoring transpeptidase ErfK/SrfK [Sphingomonas carotinifaciens]